MPLEALRPSTPIARMYLSSEMNVKDKTQKCLHMTAGWRGQTEVSHKKSFDILNKQNTIINSPAKGLRR